MTDKKELIDAILKFIDTYKRLPYMNEDDIEIEIANDTGEKDVKSYKASRYIKSNFTSQENLTKHLFDEGVISYKFIADTLSLTEAVVENAMTQKTKNPQIDVRRKLHMFFNKDLYDKNGKYNTKCASCKKRCKQEYWVDLIQCKKYSKK